MELYRRGVLSSSNSVERSAGAEDNWGLEPSRDEKIHNLIMFREVNMLKDLPVKTASILLIFMISLVLLHLFSAEFSSFSSKNMFLMVN